MQAYIISGQDESGAPQTIRVLNTHPTHQAFTLSVTGTFDVTAMRKAIESSEVPIGFVELPISPDILTHLNLRDIDQEYVASLKGRVLRSPAIGLVLPQGVGPQAHERDVTEIIDGAHRILRRHQLGRKTFQIYLIRLADAERFRVTFELLQNGEWVKLEPDALLNRTWGRYTKPGDFTLLEAIL